MVKVHVGEICGVCVPCSGHGAFRGHGLGPWPETVLIQASGLLQGTMCTPSCRQSDTLQRSALQRPC